MSGQLSVAGQQALVVKAREFGNRKQDSQFKGLMALLAGIEKALVDIDTGLSMHSSSAKNFNMGKAKEALSTGLADFKRGNSQMLRQESGL